MLQPYLNNFLAYMSGYTSKIQGEKPGQFRSPFLLDFWIQKKITYNFPYIQGSY